MKLLIQLFLQFFHVGVFSFGGGYATLPFLYDIAEKFHWYTSKQLTDMLAISSITPGPVGVNVATFASRLPCISPVTKIKEIPSFQGNATALE